MPFWSGETLETRLDSLKLVDPFDPDLIDCAAYTLRIGPEIFVTSDQNKGDAKEGVKIPLGDDEPFKIPPGQFAFLLSEERVRVPNNALAFISFKTSQKWLGLVNVSGFHVDPGWDGNLMFGVYNAGPGPVNLRRGMPMFLIWYADLDRTSSEIYKPDGEKGTRRIPEKYVNTMSGQVFSPMVLASDLKEVGKELQGLKERLEVLRAIAIGIGTAIAGILLTLAVGYITRQWSAAVAGPAPHGGIPYIVPGHQSPKPESPPQQYPAHPPVQPTKPPSDLRTPTQPTNATPKTDAKPGA